jgi:DNA invertase Pin-like site-specific DNA recombinase
MNHIIGYARVSTTSQNLDSQIDRLEEAGCEKIFTDKFTGTITDRPGWDELMKYLRTGDTLVVTEFSRMSRSRDDLVAIVNDIQARGITLRSLSEQIDTETAMGRFLFSITAAIAQMELEGKQERAAAGRAAAKARGKSGGRPRTDPELLQNAMVLYQNTKKTAQEVCSLYGFSPRTLSAYMKKEKDKSLLIT